MTSPRSDLIPESSGGMFHLVTRCVRRERLLDRGERKEWLCRGLAGWFRHMCIKSEVWLATMKEGGSRLDSALGGPEVRQRWAVSRGQRWAADKSGLWELLGKER